MNNHSWHKTIANTGFGNKVAGARGITLQGLSQVTHINTQLLAVLDGVRSPDLVQQLALGQHFPGVVEQHGQQAKLNRC